MPLLPNITIRKDVVGVTNRYDGSDNLVHILSNAKHTAPFGLTLPGEKLTRETVQIAHDNEVYKHCVLRCQEEDLDELGFRPHSTLYALLLSDTPKSVPMSFGYHIMAKFDGKTIGRAFVYLLDKTAYMEDVFVDPQFEGKGIATSLVDRVVQESMEAEVGTLLCTARSESTGALKIYSRMGFVEVGVNYRKDDFHDL